MAGGLLLLLLLWWWLLLRCAHARREWVGAAWHEAREHWRRRWHRLREARRGNTPWPARRGLRGALLRWQRHGARHRRVPKARREPESRGKACSWRRVRDSSKTEPPGDRFSYLHLEEGLSHPLPGLDLDPKTDPPAGACAKGPLLASWPLPRAKQEAGKEGA